MADTLLIDLSRLQFVLTAMLYFLYVFIKPWHVRSHRSNGNGSCYGAVPES